MLIPITFAIKLFKDEFSVMVDAFNPIPFYDYSHIENKKNVTNGAIDIIEENIVVNDAHINSFEKYVNGDQYGDNDSNI